MNAYPEDSSSYMVHPVDSWIPTSSMVSCGCPTCVSQGQYSHYTAAPESNVPVSYTHQYHQTTYPQQQYSHNDNAYITHSSYTNGNECRCDQCMGGGLHHSYSHQPIQFNNVSSSSSTTSVAPMYPPLGLGQFDFSSMQSSAPTTFPVPSRDMYCGETSRPVVQRDVPVTAESFQRVVGQMFDISRTSGGSSFLQACLKDKDPVKFETIYTELQPHIAELLLDSHGCYVMRSLFELMNMEQIDDVLTTLSRDDQLVFSLCTHSLHTRRIIQYLLEISREKALSFIVDVMINHCREIATTQQGCIAMQRVMDCAADEQRRVMFEKIYNNLMDFAYDPFANYVVQYILEKGDKAVTSEKVWNCFKGNVTSLACNKFASNVVEKALHHSSPDVQHLVVSELYSNSSEFLQGMLQDSFGNYIVQATIALCSFKDVWVISEKLKPILHTTPYGYKIAARLERRLKGKPLTNARTVSYVQNQHLRS